VHVVIKANKTFDLVVILGAGHGAGGAYGDRKRFDFFVEHLLGLRPANWNEVILTVPEVAADEEPPEEGVPWVTPDERDRAPAA
jgi:hypothetical protein